jgi:hypothetical protein
MKAIRFFTAFCCLILICSWQTAAQKVIFKTDVYPVKPMISVQDALVATHHFLSKYDADQAIVVSDHELLKHGNEPVAHIFKLSPAGYMVVTATNILPPLIAYSFVNDFGELHQNNPLYNLLRADLGSRLTYLRLDGDECVVKNLKEWELVLRTTDVNDGRDGFQQWPAEGNGWLKTNWTQNYPYNLLCPIDPVTQQRSLAGCPAVAMAQIVNFHQTTNYIQFDDTDDYYHNYAGRQYWIDNDHAAHDFPSFPQLNAHLNALNEHYINNIALTSQDMAALTFASGVACKQVFTSQASGTFGVGQAYQAFQRFGFTNATLLDENSFNLYSRIQQNIKDTMPVHLAVVDASWTIGHNVVIDGYNTNGYYHLNFGWGGSANGWYLLPQEIPYNLNVVEGAVVDIKPITTSVAELDSARRGGLLIYPNPASVKVNIEFSNACMEPCIIRIYSAYGQMIHVIENITGNSAVVELNGFKNGVYFFELSNQKERVRIGRFVVE